MLKLFTVYDSKALAWLPPFTMRAKGEALRAWHSTVNDPQTNFCKYPADFTLFEIGEFSEETGACTMYESKVPLGTALEFKDRPQQEAPLLKAIDEVKQEA